MTSPMSQGARLDRHQWSAVAASFLGWTLDAFDFFLMVFMFSAIATEFHTNVAAVAVASTLTLAARPFGALVFGMLADRFGRRPVLMVDILLYSALEFASAFAPSLAVLLILRAAFGFAMGGEWGVGASLAMESIPPKARGFVSGLLQEGYAAGYLLASRGVLPPVRPHRLARHVHGRRWLPRCWPCFMRFGVQGIAGVRGPARRRRARRSPLLLLAIGAGGAGRRHRRRPWSGAPTPAAMLPWVYFVDAPDRALRPVVLPPALEDGALRRGADDRLQLLQPRHPGPLPDLPAEAASPRHPAPVGMLTAI